jgi:hypothetical protein
MDEHHIFKLACRFIDTRTIYPENIIMTRHSGISVCDKGTPRIQYTNSYSYY